MKLNIFKADGTASEDINVSNFPILDEGKGIDALRQCVIAVRANQRQGNASTKTRDEVSGSGKKIYRQKGLGTGRAGDKRAIQRKGGGVAFGPKPRSYSQKTNLKVKRLALTRALVDCTNDGNVSVIENWVLTSPKTKELCGLLRTLGAKRKVLLISDSFDQNITLASRNLPYVRLSKSAEVSALDVISAQSVIFSQEGLNALLDRIATN